ncbi:MAG TPA: ABC transporter permease [Solirubrobacteraceae bacterium]
MGQRKLRSALTAVAILLGVAMIAGTYVQTDQIRTAFEDIEQTANGGVDADMAPRTAFRSTFGSNDLMDERLVARASRVQGVADVQGELFQTGSLVVGRKIVEPKFAPAIVVSAMRAAFDPLRHVAGRLPRGRGEVLVNRKLAEDEHLSLGQRVGVTTRTGIHRVRLVGIAEYGNVASIGGATLIVAPLADVQAWYGLEGKVSRVVASAAPGVAPAELVRRLRAVLPRDVEIKTGQQSAADEAKHASDSIGGFLTPALLAFSGAALLVGAFIIFNTFSISVAQRRREFALLRSLGATRRQVLMAVAAEALLLGVAASVLGLLTGLGFARGLGALFDAAGWGIPRGAMQLAPRTIGVGLTVGIGVTLVAALVPAVRATRVPPVAAMRDDALAEGAPRSRRRQMATALVGLAGLGLLLQGLLGGGTATSRLTAMGVGSLLVFVGVALSARYAVRPLAAVVGWPLQRLGHATGELARDNATRNPARTAVTASALMVGLALVVFVSVFAAGLKDTLNGSIEDRLKADLVVRSDTIAPLSRAAGPRIERVPSVVATAPLYIDQVQVGGRKANAITDLVTGIDPLALRDGYAFQWLHGSDADLQRVVGTSAIVEEQFAKAHGLSVGERFHVTGPTGHTATLTAIAEYRDPQVLQGVMVDTAQFRALSSLRDPLAYFVTLVPGTRDVGAVQREVKAALAGFPSAKVRTRAQYADYLGGQLDQIVYLLYALLAMSIVISMFGIANSLFLSIHERTRELGMLRAIGATAAQVRRMIRYESVITSLIGGVLGTGVGILFAWLTTFAVEDLGVGFTIPVGQLAVFLVLAVVVGVIGAVAPARRASRLHILDAVHAE